MPPSDASPVTLPLCKRIALCKRVPLPPTSPHHHPPTLLPVQVGTILLGHIAHIEWDDIGIAIPAFLTMVLMPFTYSGGCGGGVWWGVVVGCVGG